VGHLLFMKKGFLLITAVVFLQAAARAQLSPILEMTNANGSMVLSWSGIPALCTIQQTTDLSQPNSWTPWEPAFACSSATVFIPPNQAQQFFRLASIIPLFEFGIFYQVNLEINPLTSLTINGPVFCNQNIWVGTASCTFDSSVTAVGTNAVQVADPFSYDYPWSGSPVYAGGPPTSYATPLDLCAAGTNYSPATLQPFLELPPNSYAMGSAAAYSSNGLAYLANSCDLVISNFASGTNFGPTLRKELV
jgi:hypothetical protein